QSSAKWRRGIGKKAESRAGVFQVGQPKEARDNIDGIFQRNGLSDCPLGNPVQQQHGKCDQQRALGHGVIYCVATFSPWAFSSCGVRKISLNSRSAPTTMALSAILNAGQ